MADDVVDEGRDVSGKFTAGNRESTKTRRPRQRTSMFRAELLRKITRADFSAIIDALLEQARAGERWAVVEVIRLLVGKPGEIELDERLKSVEQAAGAKKR